VRWEALLVVSVLAMTLAGCSTRSQRLYRRAEAFLAQGQVELAAKEYEALVKEFPRDPIADDALYKLAYVHAEEMDKPSLALVDYRWLADKYPSSPYADDALMHVMEIQRTALHDPAGVKQTCDEICSRFSGRPQLCARAQIGLATAQFDSEQYKPATETAKKLIEDYPKQKRQCAQAALLVARATERMGAGREKAVALYRQVVADYPDTHSAALAKSRAGWLYFEKGEQDQQKQQEEEKRKSRIVKGVPPHGAGADTGQLQALSALRSLLAHRGEARTLDELLALSGVAFQFVFDPGRPTVGRGVFVGNPFETVAEDLGFACNVWSSQDAEQAFASVHQALLQAHPVMILYDAAPTSWVIVTGYDLSSGRVYFMPPGRQEYATASRKTFLTRWASSSRALMTPMAPGPFYQFSLAARLRNPPEAEVVREALKRAVDVMRRRELQGVPAGAAAYEKLAAHLESCVAPEATLQREQTRRWAELTLPAHLSARKAGVAYLQHAAQVLSGAAGRLNDISQGCSEAATETALLSQEIHEALAQQDDASEKWQAAAAQARYVAALEARTAEQLSGVLERVDAGGG